MAGRGPWVSEDEYREQIHRSLASGRREQASLRRLNTVWAEADAAETARLGEDRMKGGFTCRHCGSWYPEAHRLAAHERECGRVGEQQEKEKEATMPGNGRRPVRCKYCGHTSPGLTEHNTHLLQAHREETLARRRKLFEERTRDEGKMDAALSGAGAGKRTDQAPAVPGPCTPAVAAVPRPGNGRSHAAHPAATLPGGPCCPLCGGTLPVATAELVAEFTRTGIPEPQAFELVRTARRLLLTGAMA